MVRIRLEGANAESAATGIDALPGRSNYFIGKDRSKWRTGVANYAGVRFEGVYPGINLVYRGTQGRLEYDFVIAPHADPSRIRMNVEGAENLHIDRDGNLVIKTSDGEVIQKAPVIYQERDGIRHPVAGGYKLTGKHTVTFSRASYDRNLPLVIDPLLTYVSYLGGSGGDSASSIAVDSTGAALVTGMTASTDFPVSANALQPNYFGNGDIFVAKVSSDGKDLVYSTYVGGSNYESANDIAVDPAGNAYVTGGTFSADFPVSLGAFRTTPNGAFSSSVYAIKLDSAGGLIYSTFLDQGGGSTGRAIVANAEGEAWLTGAPGNQFPVTAGSLQSQCSSFPGACGLFLTELNAQGTNLVYSALFGSSSSRSFNIALDGNENIYLAGEMEQKTPIPGLPCSTNSTECSFLLKIDRSASSIVFARSFVVLAGSENLAVDHAGNSHLLILAANLNASQIVNVNADGSNGPPSSHLFGAGVGEGTFGNAIGLDSFGNIFVVGLVTKDDSLSPTVGAFQTKFGGGSVDAFLTELDPTGNLKLYSTFIGGSGNDSATAIASDSMGNAYISGVTDSADLPVTDGVFQPSLGGPNGNAFVARIDPDLPVTVTATMTATPTTTASPTATSTGTPIPPTITATQTVPRTPLPTHATSPSATPTAGPTSLGGSTLTPTQTPTATATATPTATSTPVGPLIYSPTTLRYPTKAIGKHTAVKFVTVKNPRKDHVSISIDGISLQAQDAGFSIDTTKSTCSAGHVLDAGKSCRIGIIFQPVASGPASDTLLITGDMTNSGSAATLTGTGK